MAAGGPRWQVCADADGLAAAATQRILAAARAAIAARGDFHLVLAGGETPLPVYRLLAAADAQWWGWHLYFGDERWLPPGHPGRNETAIRRAWLDRSPIPAMQIHPIAPQTSPEQAATCYREVLRGVAQFDLVLLGLGADGHTASLFPGASTGAEDVFAVRAAPGPFPARITLSPERLRRSRELVFVVAGAGKRPVLAAWRSGADLPAARVARGHPEVLVMLDAAADPDCGGSRAETR
ncbi:MAG: 6-phosphogluconolactonase [Porticoccaceae bacterium]